MSVDSLFDNFRLFLIRNYRVYCVKKSHAHYLKLLKKHNIQRKKLSSLQEKEVDAIWKGLGTYDYNTHEMVYSVTGKFSPEIVPEMLFRTRIELDMNNQSFKNAWADKSYFSFHFPKELFPLTIVSNVNGIFYDDNYNVINREEALKKISEYEEYVVKPSLDSGLGKGVGKYTKAQNVEEVLNTYRENYIVQEVFKQHNMLSEFNPSSVNVIRYISLFINGRVIPVMAALRCGAEGSFNDNDITKDGLGMIVIGIDENGILKDRAYHSCGKALTKCPNGVDFCGKAIPGFDKIKDIIIDLHSKLGYFGFMGWDFVIDEQGEPRIMEYNIKGPGVLYYQYVNGPLFGEYTKEVIDWLKNNK